MIENRLYIDISFPSLQTLKNYLQSKHLIPASNEFDNQIHLVLINICNTHLCYIYL